MTAKVWWLVGIATVLAVIDWTAVVVKQSRPIEMFAKPATMLALVAAAIAVAMMRQGPTSWHHLWTSAGPDRHFGLWIPGDSGHASR